MTDYIVSGCEFAPMNGTYVEYSPDSWVLYDGENPYFVMQCYGSEYGDVAYGRIFDFINSEAQVNFEFPDWYDETVAPDDTGILFYLRKNSEPPFDGYSDMVITTAGGSAPDELTSTNVSFGTSVSKPTLTETASATALASKSVSSATSVSKSALSQAHTLTSKNVSSATSVSKPAISQTHALASKNVSSGTSVSKPTIQVTVLLVSQDITSAVSVSKPTLTQTHVLTSKDVTVGISVSQASMAGTNALIAKDVHIGVSVSKPTLTQTYIALDDQDIFIGVSVSKPSLTQHHMLASQDVTMGMSVSTNMFVFVLTSTPECRVYAIFAEDRMYIINQENRTLEVRCH